MKGKPTSSGGQGSNEAWAGAKKSVSWWEKTAAMGCRSRRTYLWVLFGQAAGSGHMAVVYMCAWVGWEGRGLP